MDESYFERHLSFRSAGELLNLKFHRSVEETTRNWLHRPLNQPSPVIYVHARPYVLRENLVLTIQLEPKNDPDGGPIGEVAGSRYGKPSEQEIGNAQAWLYPEQSKALLWECALFRDFRTKERQRALWMAFEELIQGQTTIQEVNSRTGTRTSTRGRFDGCSASWDTHPSKAQDSRRSPIRGRPPAFLTSRHSPSWAGRKSCPFSFKHLSALLMCRDSGPWYTTSCSLFGASDFWYENGILTGADNSKKRTWRSRSVRTSCLGRLENVRAGLRVLARAGTLWSERRFET